ncbi:MAG: hypothetical protein ACE5G3_09965 [Gammaproteobacteria bacterium]
MNDKNVMSLRRYRAQRCFDGYLSLPRSQRTSSRSALLLEAIFDYAYESVPRHQVTSARQIRVDADESRRICRRLEEFIPRDRADDGEPIMSWLHDHMLLDAWTYPDDIRSLVSDILRDS